MATKSLGSPLSRIFHLQYVVLYLVWRLGDVDKRPAVGFYDSYIHTNYAVSLSTSKRVDTASQYTLLYSTFVNSPSPMMSLTLKTILLIN